jgi:eukaryotic-like serine/threonine-protein kinase
MSLQVVANSRIGRVLRGKYRLERVLGIGGMAAVYAAVHRNRRQFAVKLLHPELSNHEEIRKRFLREGYAANSVNHHGAVAVLDDDVDEDGAAFIVMELLDGSSVEQICEQQGMPLPIASVLALAEELLEVLAAAHANGIVHRDLKPANLFATRAGKLKVLDFGIARLIDTTSSLATQNGQTLGTPAFMAPEQALGKTDEIDAQTDLWAVGATLFLLSSGHYVYEAETPQQMLYATATSPARSVASVAPGLPPAVARLIDGALLHDKRERFKDAAAMQVALQRAWTELAGKTARNGTQLELARLFTARPARPQGGPTPRRERQSALVLTALLVVLLVVVSGVLLVLKQSASNHLNDEATSLSGESGPAVSEQGALAPSPASAPAAGATTVQDGRTKQVTARDRRPAHKPAERGIDPRSVPPVAHPVPTPQLRPSSAPSAACTRLLERQSLGEDLSAAERVSFAQECRQ